MAYYADLTKYEYGPSPSAVPALNVGWLARSHRYEKGDTTPEFRAKLLEYCRQPSQLSHGGHECTLHGPVRILKEVWAGLWDRKPALKFRGGSGKSYVIHTDGTVFVAPNMIYHYVESHAYKPPDRFIEAVNEGRLIESEVLFVLSYLLQRIDIAPAGVESPSPAPVHRMRIVEELTIGRGPDNDIQLDDEKVSAHHAVIERKRDGYFVRDLGKTSGIFVDGRRVPEYLLSDGSVFFVGPYEMRFEGPDELSARDESAAGTRSPEVVWPSMRKRIAIENRDIPSEALGELPEFFARTYHVLPVSLTGDKLMVAVLDSFTDHCVKILNRLTPYEIEPVSAERSNLDEAIEKHYGERV